MSRSDKNHFLVRVALFSALWSVLELTLGALFKGLRLPFGGAIMSGMAVILLITARSTISGRGSLIMIGAITAFIRIFSSGAFLPSPVIAIFMESLLVELTFTLFGFHRWSIRLAAVIAVLYTVVHPFLTQGLLFGVDTASLYLNLFERAARMLYIQSHPVGILLLIYLALHVLIGHVAAAMAMRITCFIKPTLRVHA